MSTSRRSYDVAARSTDVLGRVLCSTRDQHIVVDGPVQNGCPGEAITPAEIFLGGVATCGVELVQVLARDAGIPLGPVRCDISGTIDRSLALHDTYTLFQTVNIRFFLGGITREDGEILVKGFKGR